MSQLNSPKKSARGSTSSGQDPQLLAQIKELRDHNTELRKELKEFNSALEVIKVQHEKALTEARAKNQKRDKTDGPLTGTPVSKGGSEAAQDAELKASSQKIAILTRANADLKKAATGSGPDKIRKLMSEITQLKDVKHEQKVEISTLKNEVARMRSTAFALQTDEDKANLAFLEKQIRTANAKAADMKKQLDASERRSVKQQEALVEFKNKAQNLQGQVEAKGRTHSEVQLQEQIANMKKEAEQLAEQRESERKQQSLIVRQFERKIQILEIQNRGLKEQMAKANITPEEVKINMQPQKLANPMTKAQLLRKRKIDAKRIEDEKNRNPVLLAKIPKSAKKSARSPPPQSPAAGS